MKWVGMGAYLGMIVVNGMANGLPINNLDTGQVSDLYPNLFAPAGITFSIWGVIYLMLLVYCGYQLVLKKPTSRIFGQINKWFAVSCAVNGAWIFAWHYLQISLSVVLMLVLLGILIRINDLIREAKLDMREKLLTKLPFGVYFGWITVATVANITAWLVGIGWNGWGIPESWWMVAVLAVGVIIAAWRMHKDGNIAYGLVPVWAYAGILLKHTTESGFDGQYPLVINATLVSLAVLAAVNAGLIIRKKAF